MLELSRVFEYLKETQNGTKVKDDIAKEASSDQRT